MKRLDNSEKRGRPDIVHFALMEGLSTPLFLQRKMRVYVHTARDKVIAIADNLRIPKSYFRFEGLMVKLFNEGFVKSEQGGVLMEVVDRTVQGLLAGISPDRVVGLSSTGVRSTSENVARVITGSENSAFVIGGFPRGHFAETTSRHIGSTYSVNSEGLEAHVVIARVIYECEKLLEKGVHHEGDKEGSKVGARELEDGP
jgi:rRNA small subunit pseudouridine methyltransferase Nep1